MEFWKELCIYHCEMILEKKKSDNLKETPFLFKVNRVGIFVGL